MAAEMPSPKSLVETRSNSPAALTTTRLVVNHDRPWAGSANPRIDTTSARISNFAFPSRVDHDGHIGTRQYARLVDEWIEAAGLRREDYGTHSLRWTKASIIYTATGNLRAVQILLGHTKIENTIRYLVDIEDALVIAETTEIIIAIPASRGPLWSAGPKRAKSSGILPGYAPWG